MELLSCETGFIPRVWYPSKCCTYICIFPQELQNQLGNLPSRYQFLYLHLYLYFFFFNISPPKGVPVLPSQDEGIILSGNSLAIQVKAWMVMMMMAKLEKLLFVVKPSLASCQNGNKVQDEGIIRKQFKFLAPPGAPNLPTFHTIFKLPKFFNQLSDE